MEKPALLNQRFYRPQDLPLILAFLGKLQASCRHPALHPGDLIWWMLQTETFAPQQSIQILESSAGSIQALLFSDPPEWCALTLAEGEQDVSLSVKAAENFVRHHGKRELTLRTGSGQPELKKWLLEQGYAQTSSRSLWMEFDPSPTVANPILPEEYGITCMQELQNWPARVKVHQQVWNSGRFTLQAMHNLRKSSLYDPALDMVVLAPDGSVAAYALIWLDPVSQTATFEPVGVHPAHQRKGLGRAVMQAGLLALQRRGATRITVSTRESNTPAVQLYASLGFRTSGHFLNFRKEL